jgi:parallel beta-helix repeat protein
MSTGIRSFLASTGLGVALAAGAAHGHGLPGVVVTCGQIVTTSIRVTNNLVDCPDHGLVVGAPNITIDLNGHRFDGTGGAGDNGIDNTGNHGNVTVRNGVLTGFSNGVQWGDGEGGEISGLTVLDSENHGFLISFPKRLAIVGNKIRGSVNNGMLIGGMEQSLLKDNLVSDNVISGILINNFSKELTITGNRAVGNANYGFSFDRTSLSSIRRNTAVGNGAEGFRFLSATDANDVRSNVSTGNGLGFAVFDQADENRFTGNVATGNVEHGFLIADTSDNVLTANRIVGNGGNGVHIDGASGTVLSRNQVNENGGHGIYSDVNTLQLDRNNANRNGLLNGVSDDVGLGIFVPAATPSSGNRALENDDPNECEAADQSCHVAP